MHVLLRTIAFACAVAVSILGPAAAQDVLISGGRIIDGTGNVIFGGSVLVREGRIVSVTREAPRARGAIEIDARGKTVMPAFIDAHRHIIDGDPARWLEEHAADRMHEFLDAGFTTILSAGDPLEAILELRRRLDSGEIQGPRLIAAGIVPLAASAGFAAGVDPARLDRSRPPNRPTEAAPAIPDQQTRDNVRRAVEAGVDAIKTILSVTPGGPEQATLRVVVEEAARFGIPTITHAVSVEDTVAAVEAGVSVLVHTPHIGQLDPDTARMIATAGIPMMSTLGVFVPTFAESNALVRARTGEDNLPRFRDLDPFPFATLSSAGQGPVNARLLWEAGITYGYGTDTRFLPRDSLAHELRPLRLVFSNRDIVEIMTRNSAATIGRGNELGTLEPGKRGDIVVLGGDPLEDIDSLLDVEVVVKDGKVVIDKR